MEGHGHVVDKKLYFAIFGALLVLTGLTTGVAFIDLGKWNTVVALVIAVSKATLVAIFFMHLKWSSMLMRVAFFAALLWLAIMISVTSIDFLTRDWIPVPKKWNDSSQLRVPTNPRTLPHLIG
jgi:cytochrome c oxidase subunit IV